jgi:hypothetical protein
MNDLDSRIRRLFDTAAPVTLDEIKNRHLATTPAQNPRHQNYRRIAIAVGACVAVIAGVVAIATHRHPGTSTVAVETPPTAGPATPAGGVPAGLMPRSSTVTRHGVTVTVVLDRTRLPANTTLDGTVTVTNRSGKTISEPLACRGSVVTIGLSNGKLTSVGSWSAIGCRKAFTFGPGTTTLAVNVTTTARTSAGASPLPPGSYQTKLYFNRFPLPVPPAIPVTILASGTTPTVPAASTPTCAPAQLSLRGSWYAEAGGQFTQTLTFTNQGQLSCQLSGWPSFEALNARGDQSPGKNVNVRQDLPPQPAWRPVTIAAGGTASFDVYGGDFNPVQNRACPTTASALVIPPNTSSPVRVDIDIPSCGGFSVAPVVAGGTDHRMWNETVPAA